MPPDEICQSGKRRSEMALELSNMADEIKSEREKMSCHLRAYHQSYKTLIQKMSKAAQYEFEYMKSVTSK